MGPRDARHARAAMGQGFQFERSTETKVASAGDLRSARNYPLPALTTLSARFPLRGLPSWLYLHIHRGASFLRTHFFRIGLTDPFHHDCFMRCGRRCGDLHEREPIDGMPWANADQLRGLGKQFKHKIILECYPRHFFHQV